MNIAIILGAGNSIRMRGKTNKVFLKIAGKPLIYWTIRAFQKHKMISGIISVVKKKEFAQMRGIVKKNGFSKVIFIVEGGKMRQDSAYQGLKAIEDVSPGSCRVSRETFCGERNPTISGSRMFHVKHSDIVLFHNAANPLVSHEEITEVIAAAKKHGAALAAQPVKDTVKQINNSLFVGKTLDREKLWLAQTPQAIKYKLAKIAFEKAKKQGFYGTDDVSLVERLGKPVKIVPGSWRNIKVTTREDLNFVKNWVKNDKNS